jgi:hypothetical protein
MDLPTFPTFLGEEASQTILSNFCIFVALLRLLSPRILPNY